MKRQGTIEDKQQAKRDELDRDSETRPTDKYCQRDKAETRRSKKPQKPGRIVTAHNLAQNILKGGRPPSDKKLKRSLIRP